MFDWIKNFFVSTIRQFGAILCQWIYNLISWLYELFMTITKVNILSSEDIQPIYERVTMILTIVMVFYITFEVVKYVVSPDTISDKEKGAGSVVKRMIIVIILIAFVPKIFTLAYDLQNKIINNQVIPKIIVGKADSDYNNFGGDFSANLLSLFYSVDETACAAAKKDDCNVAKTIVPKNLENLRNKEKINLVQGMNKFGTITENGEENDVPIIEFDGIMAIIVGGFVVYILVLYCIDLGVRYGQLIFLQIMAPISIIGYISPKKDGIFQTWTKQCITTYIDLFIRMAIINFILLIISVLWKGYESGSLFTNLGEVAPTLKTFTYIALVLGLLVFAQKAPKMLEKLLPSGNAASIGYGLGASKRVAPMAARAIGGSAAGISTMGRKAIARGVNTFRRNRENEGKSKTLSERNANRRIAREKSDNLKNARRDLRNATKTGTGLEDARSRFNLAQKEHLEAQNQLAKDKNTRQRSIVGAALGGAATGLTTGIKTGSRAAKLEDISKNIKESTKIANDDVARVEKYYDNGGTGYIDRKLTQVQQSVGIQTASQRTAEEIRRIDSEIKSGEARINLQRESKKTVDSAEDRGQSKAKSGELKLSADGVSIKTGKKDASGKPITITGQAGQTLGDIYLDYKKDAEIKKMQLETAISNNADAATIAKLKQESTDADTTAGIVLKNVSRAAFTKYLQGLSPEDQKAKDGVMETHIENTKNNINRALYDTDTKNMLKASLISAGKGNLFDLLEKGEYNKMTFDDIDEIKTTLINISNESERQLSIRKDLKYKIETSDMYDAQKANDSASGVKK